MHEEGQAGGALAAAERTQWQIARRGEGGLPRAQPAGSSRHGPAATPPYRNHNSITCWPTTRRTTTGARGAEPAAGTSSLPLAAAAAVAAAAAAGWLAARAPLKRCGSSDCCFSSMIAGLLLPALAK